MSSVSRLFFFLGVSQVWEKTTRKCMVPDLHFFCNATDKKKLRDLRYFFLKKSELRFFWYTTYAFFDTRPTAKKNK